MNAFDLEKLRRHATGYAPDVEMRVRCADVLALIDLARDKQSAPSDGKRHYFVAYNFTAAGHSGNGCMSLIRDSPIRNWDDVEGICNYIAEYKGFKTVALTGWQHYEEEN